MSYPVFPAPGSLEDEPFIQFFPEDVNFDLEDPDEISAWLQEVISRENCRLLGISYVFCSDEYLHGLNLEFLQHDTYTDIITFPYSSPPSIEGDIYISIDRVMENAESFQSGFDTELRRVMVHGVLHLCGYGDETEEEEIAMRKKENEYLALFSGKK